MDDATHKRTGGPRFSLRTLMLLTTIAAMAAGLIVSAYNNRRLHATNELLAKENRRLRDEVGELSMEDATRFHAIRVAPDSDLEWVWRIWIPEGRAYRLRSVDGEIPKEGWPSGRGGTITLRSPGEHVIQYRIRRDPKDNGWYGTLSTTGGSVGKDAHPWVEWGSHTSTTGGVGTSTRVFSPTERVELCRYRVSQSDSSDKIEDPSAGFLIWLQPIK